MFVTKPQKLTLTVLVYLTIAFTLAGTAEASGFTHEGVSRRDHVNLKRMFKKRAPLPQGNTGNSGGGSSNARPIVIGAGSDPATISDSTSTSSTIALSASSTSSTVLSTSSSVLSSSSSSSASSTASSSQPTSSVISTSSIESSSSSSSATSSSSSAPPVQTSETLNLTAVSQAVGPESRTITRTASESAAAQTGTAPPPTAAAQKKSNVLTVLIVVASSVGGVAILWTIFRKWKLARSSKFDERLQPIDWQPTNPDEGIIPAHRRVTSDTSFQSGSNHHGDNFGRAVNAGYGATSDHGHGGSDYGHGSSAHDHDFAAGPTHLAPVGGYADLARGPSPQPQMQQLARGPSLNRPNYEVGVPLHHQTGYAEAYDYNGGPVRF